jgi:hypothetical protein
VHRARKASNPNTILKVPPGKTTGTHVQEAGWAPGPVWMGAENPTPTGIRSPDCPARSESLYRLSYPGPQRDFKNLKCISPKNTFLQNSEPWLRRLVAGFSLQRTWLDPKTVQVARGHISPILWNMPTESCAKFRRGRGESAFLFTFNCHFDCKKDKIKQPPYISGKVKSLFLSVLYPYVSCEYKEKLEVRFNFGITAYHDSFAASNHM